MSGIGPVPGGPPPRPPQQQTQQSNVGGNQTQQVGTGSQQTQQSNVGGSQTQQAGTGPVGQGEHTVREGECISSIAKESGHFWETIWNDPGNSDLKSSRKDPNVLLPGDKVTVPELRPKEESCATEEHHRFRRKGEPTLLRLRLVKEPEMAEEDPKDREATQVEDSGPDDFAGGDPEVKPSRKEDEPQSNVPYLLIVNGVHHEGTTDDDGRIEVPIPGTARQGTLILNPGTEDESKQILKLGSVGPITELSGIRERLANLTFDPGDFGEEMTPGLRQALRAFQEKHGLEITGEPDQATKDKLLEVHGC